MTLTSGFTMARIALGAWLVCVAVGCGLILGVGDEHLASMDDGGRDVFVPVPSADARSPVEDHASPPEDSATDGEDARAEAGDGTLDASPSMQAHYGGGRVLAHVKTLVAIYWGDWQSDLEDHYESAFEPFFGAIVQTPFFGAINQYYATADGGRDYVSLPSLTFQAARYFHDPQDGGTDDPDTFIESIASAASDPDAVYIIFFPYGTSLCGARDGCSGLTQNLRVPYLRVQCTDDFVASSRAAFRELVDVIVDSDGEGWSVRLQGSNYGLGDLCSKSIGGGGLGNEVTIRLWDSTVIYGSDGMFSALSNNGSGACVNSLAAQALAAAVAADGGTSAYALIGTPAPSDGLPVTTVPPTDNVSIAAGPLGIAWDGIWTTTPDAGGSFFESWPATNDLSSRPWGAYAASTSLPNPYTTMSAMDVAMQGEARWDAFAVAFAPADDAGEPGPQLVHYYWDNYLSPAVAWVPFGDGTSLPKVTRIISGPGTTSYAPGRIDAFVLGAAPDGIHVLHAWCDDRQNGVHVVGANCVDPTGWADLGMPPDGIMLVGDPDAASWPSGTNDAGHFAVVCAAADGTVRLLQDDDGQTRWSVLALPPSLAFAPGPTISGMGDHRYLVAARATDGSVWQWLYDWGPGTWRRSAIPAGSVAIDMTSY
jgi:hypothetical protein